MTRAGRDTAEAKERKGRKAPRPSNEKPVKMGPGPGLWGGKKPPKAQRTYKGNGGYKAVLSVALREVTAALPALAPRDAMSPEALDEAYNWLACGGTTTGYAEAVGLPNSTVTRWLMRDEERYQKAKEDGAEVILDALARIAVTPDYQTETTVITDSDGKRRVIEKTADAVFARKLSVQAGLELLKIRFPKRFGSHSTTDVNVTFASAIAAAKSRVARSGSEPDDVIDVEPVRASGAAPQSALERAVSRLAVPASAAPLVLPETPQTAQAPAITPLPMEESDDDWLS